MEDGESLRDWPSAKCSHASGMAEPFIHAKEMTFSAFAPIASRQHSDGLARPMHVRAYAYRDCLVAVGRRPSYGGEPCARFVRAAYRNRHHHTIGNVKMNRPTPRGRRTFVAALGATLAGLALPSWAAYRA